MFDAKCIIAVQYFKEKEYEKTSHDVSENKKWSDSGLNVVQRAVEGPYVARGWTKNNKYI